ncbi:Usher syndrome type-1C protein-binding protein 1 isoform X2 [Echinops telfairi]|uniref:Usher syndrome type-1C protein-binding protein 1 isoform X2 n=1 Tax=Echinops telfairi TaxID=9371 RepID=A0AC55DTN2_ECHTE|nr:Usher syndrome type-1C protein-binding protein 1 isoform X2 [Echinops telfairi]
MNPQAKRPRSRRGRHPPAVELDPVVESSEEVEAATESPKPGPQETPQESPGESEPPSLSAEAGGQDAGGRTDPALDEDAGGRLAPALEGPPEPAEETHQASEAAPQGGERALPPADPAGVFQTLQQALSSLEAAAAVWRQQAPSCLGLVEAEGWGSAGPRTGLQGAGRGHREAARLTERNAWLQLALGSRKAELARTQASLQAIQAEKETLQKEVQELQDSLLRLKPFPPPSPSRVGSLGSGSSSPGPDGEPWGAQDPFPLPHPLLRRFRSNSSTEILGPGPPSSQPLAPEMHIMEAQLDQLRGHIEKLKCFNRLLSAVLQGYKSRCEGLSMQLHQREAQATALHLALHYSEHCEEAWGALLALRQAAQATAEGAAVGDLQAAEKMVWRLLANEEAALAGGAPGEVQPSPQGSSVDRPTLQEMTAQLRGYIQHLQEYRALVKIPPEPGPTLEPVPNVPRAEAMLPTMMGAQTGPPLPRLEKTQIQQSREAAREILADLTLQLQLARREKRGLELREATLRTVGPAHLLLLQQLRWEQTQLRAGGEGSSGGDGSGSGSSGDEEEWPQGPLAVRGGTGGTDGGAVGRARDPGERARELQASLIRAEDLRGQLRDLREELEQVAQKARARHAHSAKLNRDLCRAHRALVLAFRGAHRKQEQQQRSLEQQVAFMEARQAEELALLDATARALGRPRRAHQLPQLGETLL